MVGAPGRGTWWGHLVGAPGGGTWWGHLVGAPPTNMSPPAPAGDPPGYPPRRPGTWSHTLTHTTHTHTHTPKDIIRTQKINILGKKNVFENVAFSINYWIFSWFWKWKCDESFPQALHILGNEHDMQSWNIGTRCMESIDKNIIIIVYSNSIARCFHFPNATSEHA